MPALIIDNYDSFTFNLVHAVAAITGEMPIIIRNDQMTWEEVRKLSFDCIVVSPGPGRPDQERDFGVSRDAIQFAEVPVLGVCLGHQGIASVFGGVVERIDPMHGRSSEIIHGGDPLFAGIPEHFSAVRYHSLGVLEPLPPELLKIAWLHDGTVMALRHTSRPIWGVQFHPESISSEYGAELLRNFLAVARPSQGTPLPQPPEVLFRELFSGERNAFWLDGRIAYMGASDEVVAGSVEDAFDRIDSLLTDGTGAQGLPFPFTGGYVGYFGYEGNSVLMRVERFIAIDTVAKTLYIVGPGDWAATIRRRIGAIEYRPAAPQPRRSKPLTRYSIPRAEYLDKVRECLALIHAGESYELCLTNKLFLETDIAPLDYYESLRRTNPAPYAAFLQLGDISIASSSPECFLRIDENRRAESRPIKGTIRRGATPAEDVQLRELLASNERFRAENLMIVDLVRHDLSRVSEVGTVKVPRLMEVETYATVHQLVSTIEGQLRPDATMGDCLRALFPGGSMTGAPKLRSIEILKSLEPDPRGIYSGSIGFLGFNGTADLSIVIRTAVFEGNKVSLGVGGAIVAQSDPEAEWDEMELKSQALLRAFELA